MKETREMAPVTDGVHFPTLLAHLIKLGQDEEAADAADAAAAARAASKNASLLPKPACAAAAAAATPAEKDAMFARDSASVREWMRHAVEAGLADAVVVSSAATLAVRYLRRRYHYPALPRTQSTGANHGGTTNGTVRQRHRGRGNRRRRTPSAGVLSELLAVTCLHLSSKYHCVEALEARAFGSPLSMSRVFSLGYDISLSMSAALNASFRANPCTLQSLFCDLADESAVVRACSEWFALCLVLLLEPSREQTRPAPPSRHGRHLLFSPASSSASTAPFTPASDSASTTATPASTTRSPAAPASSGNGGSGGSSPTPGNNSGSSSGSGGVLLHRDQCSRATVLAVGSLVLARRLAGARGPCLPAHVQAALGLQDDDDALALVAEGVCLARKAFETQTPPEEEEEEEGHSGTQGKDILAGAAVFERDVASSGTTRTLLEWVTEDGDGDGDGDGAVPASRGRREAEEVAHAVALAAPPDCLGNAGAAYSGRSPPPDFVRGTTLSSAAAGGAPVSFPSDLFPTLDLPQARSPGSGSGPGSGGSPRSSSSTSDTISDTSRHGGRAGGHAFSKRGGGGGGGNSAAELETRTACSAARTKSDEGGSGVSSSQSAASSVATAGREHPHSSGSVSSGGGMAVTEKELCSSPSPFAAYAQTALTTPTHTGGSGMDGATESGGMRYSSSSSSSSDQTASAGSSARSFSFGFRSGLVASRDRRSTAPGNDERPARKRVASDHVDGGGGDGGGRSSHGGRVASNKRPRSMADRPGREKDAARWEVLVDRILAALDDHCGCSFCKGGDGVDLGSGGGPVRESRLPSPPTPSPPRPINNPPRGSPNNGVDGKRAAAPAPSVPPYLPFTPPGPPPADPLDDSTSFHGRSCLRAGASSSRVEETHCDGRRGAAGLELMDVERPAAGEGGGRGTKRAGMAAGGAGYVGPLLKMCSAAVASLAASSSTGAAIDEDTKSEEGRQSWWW